MQINKFNYVVKCITVLFIVTNAISCSPKFAQNLQPGNRYKIIQPIYLWAEYNNANNRQLSRETATAFLHSIKLAKRYFMVFQCEVPKGTIMTIIGPAPKFWSIPFTSVYYVKLDPDISRGLNVLLLPDNAPGLEGTLDGLNPILFSKMAPP